MKRPFEQKAAAARPGTKILIVGSSPCFCQGTGVAPEVENSCLLAYVENMRRDDVIAKLKKTEPVLRNYGVAALYLFGSHARDEASPNSDVDVFVDVIPGAAFGLRPYMGTFRVLEDAFERKAEIGYSTRDALSPYIRADVERDALRIF